MLYCRNASPAPLTALTQVLAQQGGQNTHFLPSIGQQEAGAWMYYHTDALGSIRHITANNSNSLGEMRYSPFGERVESTGVLPFMGFTGEPQNATTDLTYLRARYYNPSLGRFLTQDAIVPDPLNGQAWNAYAYVYNDPMNLVDSSGHNPIVAAVMGGAFGAGIDLLTQGLGNGWDCINKSQVIISGLLGAAGGLSGDAYSLLLKGHPNLKLAANVVTSAGIGALGSATNNVAAGNDPFEGVARVALISGVMGGLASKVEDFGPSAANKAGKKAHMDALVDSGGNLIGKGYSSNIDRNNLSHVTAYPKPGARRKKLIKGFFEGAGFPVANSGPLVDPFFPNNFGYWWKLPDNRPSDCGCQGKDQGKPLPKTPPGGGGGGGNSPKKMM